MCPTWQGLICLRMFHPNVHSTLAYSMDLPSLQGNTLLHQRCGDRCVSWLDHPADPKSSLRTEIDLTGLQYVVWVKYMEDR